MGQPRHSLMLAAPSLLVSPGRGRAGAWSSSLQACSAKTPAALALALALLQQAQVLVLAPRVALALVQPPQG